MFPIDLMFAVVNFPQKKKSMQFRGGQDRRFNAHIKQNDQLNSFPVDDYTMQFFQLQFQKYFWPFISVRSVKIEIYNSVIFICIQKNSPYTFDYALVTVKTSR